MHDIHLITDKDLRILFHAPTLRFFEISETLYQNTLLSLKNKTPLDPKLTDCLGLDDPAFTTEKAVDQTTEQKDTLYKVIFLSTQKCNLKCRYCSVNHGHFSEREDLVMPLQVYKDGLQYLLRKYPGGIAKIVFFGGEPLLEFPAIQAFVPYCLQEYEKRGLPAPLFRVVTNGTVFTGEMIAFFNQYHIWPIVSIDGPKPLNDFARVSPTGWSVYEKITENMRWINEMRTTPLTAEMTINREHVRSFVPGKVKDWLQELHAQGFDGFVADAVLSEDDSLGILDGLKEKYQQIYRELVDFCFEQIGEDNPMIGFHILSIIGALSRSQPFMGFCGAGTDTHVITAKGDILPCYLFYGEKDYIMGNIYYAEESTFKTVRYVFAQHEQYRPDECKTCWVRYLCNYWCCAYALKTWGTMKRIKPSECWTVQALVEGAIINLTRLQKKPAQYQRFTKSYLALKKIVASF